MRSPAAPLSVRPPLAAFCVALQCADTSKEASVDHAQPCADVGRLNERRERRQAKPLTYEEEARVKQFSPPWLSILITVLAETGLRVRKEALPLKWSDVDLESEPGCIRVRDSKTAAGVRPVWLTKHCKNTLLQWRKGLGPGFSEYVVPSPRIPSTHVS